LGQKYSGGGGGGGGATTCLGSGPANATIVCEAMPITAKAIIFFITIGSSMVNRGTPMSRPALDRKKDPHQICTGSNANQFSSKMSIVLWYNKSYPSELLSRKCLQNARVKKWASGLALTHASGAPPKSLFLLLISGISGLKDRLWAPRGYRSGERPRIPQLSGEPRV
jgi:hypothetical protein